MPIYEFFCDDCNTIYNFFSKTINTTKRPNCPKCDRKHLERRMSAFAVTGKAKEDGDQEDLPFDETKMEKAMHMLAGEADKINEDDPRQAANLMRKLTDMTGLKLGDKMEDALSRMEAGEDPEAIEQELGDIDEKDLFSVASGQKSNSRKKAPARDDTLYEM